MKEGDVTYKVKGKDVYIRTCIKMLFHQEVFYVCQLFLSL